MDLVNRILGGVVVIAANAGGAWTPIGDVTTTMLWIHGQISTVETMKVFVFILSNLFHISDLLVLFYYYIVLLSWPRHLCLIHVDLLSNIIVEVGHHQSWYLSFSFPFFSLRIMVLSRDAVFAAYYYAELGRLNC